MTSNTLLLEADNIGRQHPNGRQWLLEDVSLVVHSGQRMAVVGESGSGKTLLLRAVALLDSLQAGQIRWRGEPIRREQIPDFRRQVIYLHQRPALWEETVEAVLKQPFSLGAYRGRTFNREEVARLLGELGRDESFLRKLIRDLSGGERQIAALVRALQLEPSILLLDEPTAALDHAATRAVEAALGRWLDESADTRALVWVSHDEEQARRFCDRILSISAGRMAKESET